MSKFNLTVPSLGPKLPDFQKLVPEMRKEDLLGAHPDRQEMRNNVLRIEVLDTKNLAECRAVNGNSRSHEQIKASQVEPDKKNDQRKEDKQGPARECPGEMSK
ncbi:MAG: hypothetical protein Q9175_002516 [Cornicularia normoerica]